MLLLAPSLSAKVISWIGWSVAGAGGRGSQAQHPLDSTSRYWGTCGLLISYDIWEHEPDLGLMAECLARLPGGHGGLVGWRGPLPYLPLAVWTPPLGQEASTGRSCLRTRWQRVRSRHMALGPQRCLPFPVANI